MVTSHVPVLDTPLKLVGVLRVMGNISDRVDVLVSLDAEVLVDGDTSVFLKLESGLFEEPSSRGDSCSHNDEVGGEGVLSLERD